MVPARPASTPRRERDLDRVLRPPIEPSVVHRHPSAFCRATAACFPPCQRGRRGKRSWAGGIAVVLQVFAAHRRICFACIYVILNWPVILPSLSAAASARADIVGTRRLGWGEGRRDDSTRLAHLASSRDACQTVGCAFPVWHHPDWIGHSRWAWSTPIATSHSRSR